MHSPIADALTRIAAEANTADLMVRQRDFAGARETLRIIMRHASQMYGRLTVLSELEADAKFVAEVDRAIARSERGFPRPIPGDTPLPLSPGPGTPRPRKGKGAGSK